MTSKEQNRAKRAKTEAIIGEQRIAGQSRGKVMGAERRDPAQSSLSVCTAELLLLAHLLHHLEPPPSHPPPTLNHSLFLLPSLFPIFLFTCGSLQQLGSLLVRRTKIEEYRGRNGWREGRVGGKQRICFWRVSAAHMLSKES